MALTPKMIQTSIDNLDRSLTNHETRMLYGIMSRDVTVWEMANRTDATQEVADLVVQVMLDAYRQAITDVDRECRFRIENMTSC